jgi:hypothetical protein
MKGEGDKAFAKDREALCRENKNPGGTCQPGFGKSNHHPGKAHPGHPCEGRLGFGVVMMGEDHG